MTPELQQALDEWTRAIVDGDVDAARALVGDDFVLTSAGGVAPRVARAEWLEALPRIDTRSFAVTVVEAREFRDVAVVASRAMWAAELDGRDLSGEYALTDVFTLRDGRWLASWRVSTRLTASRPS